MRLGIVILLVCLGAVLAQESKTKETKTRPPTLRDPVDIDRMWSFHYVGVRRKGTFLDLAKPDEENKGKGRTLVITHMEIRQRQTMRWQFVERERGKRKWKNTLRRSEIFSLGWLDGTTKYMVNGYSSYVGMKFGPKSRPAIEVTQGNGDMAVYAEGYWAD